MTHALLILLILMQSPDAATSSARQHIAAGLTAEQRNDFPTAVYEFRAAIDLDPTSVEALFSLAAAEMKQSHYLAAIPELKRALEMQPDLPDAELLLGMAYLSMGYAQESIPHLKKSGELGALGIAQCEAGDASNAMINLQAALVKNPDNADVLYYLHRAGSELSSRALDRLLSVAPESPRAHQARAQNYFSLRRFPEAVQEYQKAIAIRPDVPGFRLELGQVYAISGDWPRAESQLFAEAQLQPGNAEVAYRLGDAELHLGKMNEALAQLTRSNDLRPEMSETLYSLGKASSTIDPASAERALLRVIEIEKDSPLAADAYLTLAGIHRAQGKVQQAASDTREFRRIRAASTPYSSNTP